MDAAECIGCGACVAACPNASAMLFLSAKVSHLAQLPQGQPERKERVRSMVAQHDARGSGTAPTSTSARPRARRDFGRAHRPTEPRLHHQRRQRVVK